MFTFPVAFFTSSSLLIKPASRAGSASNPANAYDGTGTPGTTTTYATMFSFTSSTTFKYETYSFTGTATYTKYKIYLTMDWIADYVTGEIGEGYGQVQIQYTLNGTTWSNAVIVDVFAGSGSYSYATPIELTVAATSLDNFKVRIGVGSTRIIAVLDPLSYIWATASVSIKDIYIAASN